MTLSGNTLRLEFHCMLLLYFVHEDSIIFRTVEDTYTLVLVFMMQPPKQHNMSDCGLYLLHFAEVFLKSPHKLLDAIVVSCFVDLRALFHTGAFDFNRSHYFFPLLLR